MVMSPSQQLVEQAIGLSNVEDNERATNILSETIKNVAGVTKALESVMGNR